MPYARNRDLPKGVRSHLPRGAQTIFRKAFNSADEQYEEESRARSVAWAAVKKKYRKDRAGEWRKKS
jgi:cation transport regulator